MPTCTHIPRQVDLACCLLYIAGIVGRVFFVFFFFADQLVAECVATQCFFFVWDVCVCLQAIIIIS